MWILKTGYEEGLAAFRAYCYSLIIATRILVDDEDLIFKDELAAEKYPHHCYQQSCGMVTLKTSQEKEPDANILYVNKYSLKTATGIHVEDWSRR
jgi:hypothetical protein